MHCHFDFSPSEEHLGHYTAAETALLGEKTHIFRRNHMLRSASRPKSLLETYVLELMEICLSHPQVSY
ncbi:hypothetical protein LshimejAT787_1201760 [Lyophyllum shimeji]|uniref:Uncharacterized protein n=1 Tax=Lyophyllum shimeji TaxID=47721 RepID=A0A9P3PTS8_LYOSH|nr:hypothetical protein LshimejAT787_1201760 [Lyophyllum shimeji]